MLMRKFYFLVVLFVVLFSFRSISQTVVGSDNAGDYTGWSNGSNLGTGFGAWELTTETEGGGFASHFLGHSVNQGFGNVNTSDQAFSMFGNGDPQAYANAKRLVTSWASGYSFEIDLAIAHRNGNKGIDIYAAGVELPVFSFNVAADEYRAQGTELEPEWVYSQHSVFHLKILQYGNHLKIILTRGTDTHSTFIPDKQFTGFQVFIGGTDVGDDRNNIHFNNLQITSASTLLFDDFNRPNSEIVGQPSSGVSGNWIEMETIDSGINTGARINDNSLRLQSNIQGREMIAFDMSDLYPVAFDASSKEMNWAFNMRADRTNPSGFNDENYGAAFVLGSNKSDYTDSGAHGYAVVIGNYATPNPKPIRLVYFENGLSENANLENVLIVHPSANKRYLSIKVSYNSCTRLWELHARDDTESFSDPSSGLFPLSASGVDTTYTSRDLPFMGSLWNHNTAGSDLMQWDNIYIPSVKPGTVIEYEWTGNQSDDFNAPDNWYPARDCPRGRDRFVFDGDASVVENVSNQNIGQLIVRNNAALTLKNFASGTVSTLSLTGGPGHDLIVESGSVLNLDVRTTTGGNGIVLDMLTETTGEIAGTLRFENTSTQSGGRHHQLLVTDTDALHIKSGGRVEANSLLSSNNPFGKSLDEDAVIFESGSTYIQGSGANPFGLSQPASKVVFNSGSRLVFSSSGGSPSIIGRNYADFEIDITGALNVTSGGNSPWTLDSIIVTNGHFNLSPTTYTMDIHCNGNIHVQPGQTFTINPVNHSTLTFIGNETQRIHGEGTLTFGDNVSMAVDNSANVGLIIEKNITLNQDFSVLNGRVQGKGNELKMTGDSSTILVNDAIKGTDVGVDEKLSLIAAGARTNITGDSLALFYNITLETNDTLAISTGLECMHGDFEVSDNAKLMINAGGYIASSNEGESRSPNYHATSQLIYNSSGPYERNMEWTGDTNPGYPGNVLIQNGTVLQTIQNNSIDSLGIQNDLFIGSENDGGGTLEMNGSGKLKVGSDALIGTATTAGHLKLSGQYGGDLELKGDFVLNENGTFNASDRAVLFTGSEDQTITSKTLSKEVTFDYLVVKKPEGGDLLLNDSPGTTVNVHGALGGNILELSNGNIDLQGQIFNLGGDDLLLSYVLVANGGSSTVTSSTMANFNVFGKKEILGTGASLLFDDSVTVNISDQVNFGAGGLTTINAILQINDSGYVHMEAPRYGESGTLKYNTGNLYHRRVEWNGTEGNPGYPNDVIVAGGTTLSAGGVDGTQTLSHFGARRDVRVEASSAIYMDYDEKNMKVALIVGRDLIINGNLSASDSIGGDIHVGRNWERSATGVFNPKNRMVLFNGSEAQTITRIGGETFDYLAFENAGVKTLNDPITVQKNLDIFSGSGALAPGAHSINLTGNWTNQEGATGFSAGTSTVVFKNTDTAQKLTAIGGENFHNVEIDIANLDSGLVLMDNMAIAKNLIFTEGLIHTNDKYVEFLDGSDYSGVGDDSYINGHVRKTGFIEGEEFLFPVGDYRSLNSGDSIINVYQPAALIPASTSSTAAFTIDYNHDNYFPGYTLPNNPPPMDETLESVSTCNYWNINRTAGSIGAKVRLYWTDACFNITEPEKLLVAKVINDINNEEEEVWTSVGGPTTYGPFTPVGGYVETSFALTDFSPFTIGTTGGINVLPIELLSFNASPKGQVVETHWVTSTEINNEYFTVERSIDAQHFTKVGRVQGAGNSTSKLSYSFIDDAPYSGVSYYRLKQTDFDGATTYSDIRSVRMDTDSQFELINVYRSVHGVNLSYRSDVEILKAEVFDMLGKRLFTTPIHNINGQSVIQPSLVRGVYLLRLSNGVEVVSGKFFY